MAKKINLLAICQRIASDMNSFGFNSINDDDEALQIASIVRSTYEKMLDTRRWPHTKKRFTLNNTSSATPTALQLPDNVNDILFIKYNIADVNQDPEDVDIDYQDPEDFLRNSCGLNVSDANVDQINGVDGEVLLIENNRVPLHYTSFDDVHATFDAYDNTVDSTLQASKTQGFGYLIPEFKLEDTFIPDLPALAFSQLISESTSACFAKLLQQVSQSDERDAKRTRQYNAREKWRMNGGLKRFNGGRAGRKGIQRRTRKRDSTG